jgi:Pro-kumamolisin, activation domain/Bacterial Ig-like domain (group 3)
MDSGKLWRMPYGAIHFKAGALTMKASFNKRLYVAGVIASGVSLCLGGAALGQTALPQSRIVEAVQGDKVVTLRGNVHPMAQPANDRGLLADQQSITKMRVLLQRSAAQETALQQLMAQQLDPSSKNFHAWLTPLEFGQQFGPADSDVQAAKDWLTSQGFTGLKVNNGKTLIEFNGTAGQVRNAFHSEVHRLSVRGEEHFANMQEPQIPAALAPVVKGVVGLHNFHPKPLLRRLGKFQRNTSTGEVTPLFTFTDVNGTFYGVGPKDFATIYNVPTTFDGTGQTIAIVAQTNINLQDVSDFRSIFGLPAYSADCSTFPSSPCLSVILNGEDPGLVSGDEGESDLDVEWSGAVAPKSKIILVATELTTSDGLGGVDSSAEFIVDNNLAPVMSDSYGSCESSLGTAGNAYYNTLWQQAAAEGITVSVSAGDNGSAGCDDQNSVKSASGGIAVSGIASTPYNVAMGGTDFDQANSQTTFWNSANGSGTQVSAKGYIPETTWNDSCASSATPNNLTTCASATATSTSAPLNIVAGSGGPSNCAFLSGTTCLSGYPKPTWQSGLTGVPNDGVRDLPDVSLFSSDGQNKSFYIVCESDQDISGDTGCNLTNFSSTSPFHDFQAVGGTSAAAPTFAGIMALVNQKTGQRQGNANPTLYAMAKSEPFSSCNSSVGNSGSSSNTTCVFNDITKGNISVPCTGAKTNCSKTTTGGFGVLVSGTPLAPAFAAGAGYDLATGLGSVNVANLINKWSTPSLISTSVTLSPATVSGTAGTGVTLSGTVSKSSGSGTPSGVVVFEDASTGTPAGNPPSVNILTGNTPSNPATLNSSGTFSVSTAFLPAGTYSLKAHYGGDTVFAPSDSAPISVTLGPQASKVVVSFVTFTSTGAVTAISTSAQSVPYGSNYILRVDVENANGTPCQNSSNAVVFICPTGTVNLLDGGAALKDFPNAQTHNASNVSQLNDRGFIEDQPILSVGAHPITATYTAAATSSYTSQASSNALSVTISQATTTTAATSSVTSIASGGTVTLTATVSSGSNSTQGPTGTVQFMNGSSSLGTAATCNATGATSSVGASCTATLTTALSALPPAIIDTPPSSPFVFLAWLAVALAMIAFMLSVILAARRKQYAYAGLAFFLIAAAALAGCGGGSSSSGGTGSRSITAKYSGDTNYAGSTSTAITIAIQ